MDAQTWVAIIVILICGGGVSVAAWEVVRALDGRRGTLTRTPPKRRIPKAVQEEIDQTPEWWDREFRRLQGLPEPQPVTRFPGRSEGEWIEDLRLCLAFGLDPRDPGSRVVDSKPPTVAELGYQPTVAQLAAFAEEEERND